MFFYKGGEGGALQQYADIYMQLEEDGLLKEPREVAEDDDEDDQDEGEDEEDHEYDDDL